VTVVRNWTSDELAQIAEAEELQIAPYKDGLIGQFTPIWVVRFGGEIYVRSYVAAGSAWYRGTKASGKGRVRLGGTEWDIALVESTEQVRAAVSVAYTSKYINYAESFLPPMLEAPAVASTMQLVPA
jgi:hypothetical protein